MAFYNFNDIGKWKIVPLSSLIFSIGEDTYSFGNLKSSSQFSLSQIVRPNDVAGSRPVGYMWKIDAIILQNNVHGLQAHLHRFSTEPISNTGDIIVSLAGIPEQPNSSTLAFNFFISAAAVRDTSVLWGFKADESGESISISMQGALSIDALSDEMIYGGVNF